MALLAAGGLAGALTATSCSTPSKGALMLALSTDMQVPKDIDVISIVISTNGVVKLDYLARAAPNGVVTLPATLPIVQPDEADATITIRVVAFQIQADGTAKARVIRDIVTTVPDARTVLLNVPLSFLDLDSVPDGGTITSPPIPDNGADGGVGDGISTYDPTMPGVVLDRCNFFTTNQTMLAGSCGPAGVDAAGLPAYSAALVFGDAGASSGCFDVSKCFTVGAASDLTNKVAASSCTLPLPDAGTQLNLSLSTTDGTGECVDAGSGHGLCIVTLDTAPTPASNPGYQVANGTISLVPEVCRLLDAGSRLFLNPTVCATKVSGTPPCQPGEEAGAPLPSVTTHASSSTSTSSGSGASSSSRPSTCGLEPGSYSCQVEGGNTVEDLSSSCTLTGTYGFTLEPDGTLSVPDGTWMPTTQGFSFSDFGVIGQCTRKS